MTPKEKRSRNVPLRFPQWQADYQAALQETDHRALFKRIGVVEPMLLNRRDELVSDQGAKEEVREIEAALKKLSAIKKDVLDFS
jgi:hypothetical protein